MSGMCAISSLVVRKNCPRSLRKICRYLPACQGARKTGLYDVRDCRQPVRSRSEEKPRGLVSPQNELPCRPQQLWSARRFADPDDDINAIARTPFRAVPRHGLIKRTPGRYILLAGGAAPRL